MSASDFKKQFSQQFSLISVPPPLDHVNPELLASWIVASSDPANSTVLQVFDVRTKEEFGRGHIAGSVHVPLDDFLANVPHLVQNLKKVFASGRTPSVVLVSLQSPDIDDAAALGLVQAWAEEREKDSTLPDASSFVHILLGGVFLWLQLNSANSALTKDFNVDYWTPFLPSASLSSPIA